MAAETVKAVDEDGTEVLFVSCLPAIAILNMHFFHFVLAGSANTRPSTTMETVN
jgi:hypothetical protein